MKIIEVRDGFIKFEADESVFLSSFVRVDGEDKSYIAQVIQQKENIFFAKILFVISNNELLNYDKTMPSDNSEIYDYTEQMLKNSFNYETPVIIGKTIDNLNNIVVDLSAFDKKTIISTDEKENNNIFVQNLAKQFDNLNKKTVVIDTLGIVNASKYSAGVDFKLPLDTASLKFLYEDCLNDATQDSKEAIIDIFKSLAEYSETVPFLPFKVLKNIVDEMVEKEHVFKLLVLKNKLAKLDKLNYFATEKSEVDNILKILNSKCSVIDLSKLDTPFVNRYLAYIYESLNKNNDTQIILEMANTLSKKSLKQVLTSTLPTTFITHSKFNYLNDIKNFFDNIIVVPSISNNQIFKIYATFFKAMNNKDCLIAGEATNYMPIVSNIQKIDDTISSKHIVSENTEPNVSENETLQDDILNKIAESDNTDELYVKNNFEEDVVAYQQNKDKVIDAIDQKSSAAVAEITENLVLPDNIDMFSDDENEKDTEIEETVFEGIETVDVDDTPLSESEQVFTDENTEEIYVEQNLQVIDDETIISEETSDTDIQNEEDETIATEDYNDYEHIDENGISAELQEGFNNTETDTYIDSDTVLEEISDTNYDNLEEISISDTNISENQDETSDIIEDKTDETIDISDIDISLEDELTNNEAIPISEEIIDVSDEIIEDSIKNEEEPSEQIIETEEIAENDDDYKTEDIVELDLSESNENDIVVNLEEDFSENIDEFREQEIIQDVDKVYTTRKEEDDDISDSDLDFIDELNNDDDALLEEASNDEAILEELAASDDDEGILEKEENNLEEIKEYEPEILERKDSTTPIVPVYDAEIPQEDLVESDPIEQGDSVIHAKYGAGIVEKMIKYGNKTLYSINFENIGRRLLDPTLTEIKKG